MAYVYRPDHPLASENGMIDRSLDYQTRTGAAPYVISDTMPETRHMATGRFHTSKSEFRKDTKASGCVEVGSETKHLLAPRKAVVLDRAKRRDDIRRSIYELKNGRKF